ncbi:hypothetical protein DV452_004798 [Geotrichum candidum]|nr:hypothetical protein DV452_004798 [Geotrichum candidum]
MVYPLDIVKTKLQVQTKPSSSNGKDDDLEKQKDESEYYTGTLDVLQKIYDKHGLAGLYHGLFGTIIGTASSNFAYFYWYGLIRAIYVRRSNGAPLSTATELALGALGGALGQMFTIPISVVTTKQQTSPDPNKTLFDTAKDVFSEDGVSGFWRGLKASLVLVVNPSITYGSYERLKSLLFPGRNFLLPRENFVIGALSKAMATIVTQPLIVAKVMQQSGALIKQADGSPPKKFNSFVDALVYLVKYEGIAGLFKGLGPQITKGVLVQGLLFMFKDQIELLIVLLFRLIKSRRRVALV